MPESFSATAGMAASIDAGARADDWDGVTHTASAIYGHADRHLICSCGLRLDGADVEQVKRLHDLHVVDEQQKLERAGAREVTPRRIGEVRDSLRDAADRKAGQQ